MEKYPGVNPYAYCLQNPIMYTDPTGMSVEFENDPNKSNKENRQARRQFMRAQRELNRKSSEAKKNWQTLVNSEHVHTIHLNKKDADGYIMQTTIPKEGYKSSTGGGTDIYIDLNKTCIQDIELGTNIIGIGHEEGHAFRFDQGLVKDDYVPNRNDINDFDKSLIHASEIKVTEEIEASHIENIIRAQIDPSGKNIQLRETYDNIAIYKRSFDGTTKATTITVDVIKPGYNYYKKKK